MQARFAPLPSANGEKVLWVDTTLTPLTLLNEAEIRLLALRDLTNVLSTAETTVNQPGDVAAVCNVLHRMAVDALQLYGVAFEALKESASSP
jgi:hypothetical protein